MEIANQITDVFQAARERLPELDEKWTQASFELGGKLPASGLMTSVQREGSLDLVLRCMEDEHATAPPMALLYQKMLSDYWISGLYDTLRLLRYRKLLESEPSHSALFAETELVRIAIDKHEIAKDKLLEMPLQLIRQPLLDRTNDAYVYDPNDPQKAHIPPVGLWPQNGSIAWHTLDFRTGAHRWVVRREVSDRVLSFWGVTP
jgi:hypothetical protein